MATVKYTKHLRKAKAKQVIVQTSNLFTYPDNAFLNLRASVSSKIRLFISNKIILALLYLIYFTTDTLNRASNVILAPEITTPPYLR